jgi:hypothetical protein
MKTKFNLLQAALDIEDDMENLRYNNIVQLIIVDYLFLAVLSGIDKGRTFVYFADATI